MTIVEKAQKQLDEHKEQELQSIAYRLLQRKESYERFLQRIEEDLEQIEKWITPNDRDYGRC